MLTELLIPPSVQPVTKDELKIALGIFTAHDDDFIAGLIAAATEYVESVCKRKLLSQTWAAHLDCFPLWAISFPFGPVRQVNSITYYDVDDELQTLDSSLYQVDTKTFLGRVAPVSGGAWPVTYDRLNAVSIEFVVGAASISGVPERAKQAIRVLAAHWYENREATIAGTIIQPVPFGLKSMIRNLWTGKL